MNKWISVKTAFDRVYHQAGFVPQSKIPNDPESKVMLEQESRKRALAHLEPHDRRQVESCVKRLKETCVGVYLGDAAALQILEHIGVFLAEVERVS